MKKVVLPLVLVIIVIALVGLWASANSNKPSASSNSPSPSATATLRPNPDGLPGLLTTQAPWPNNTAKLTDRLNAIGLPILASEGTVLHMHQHLDIFVDGQPVAVPADIGIAADMQSISHLHVHDNTGVIHVESPVKEDFYLGQFFDVWGVKFTSSQLGGYAATTDKPLAVYVNGTKVTGDPRQVKLEAHQEIAVVYGTPPTQIPSSFTFPAGD